jgi:YtkA-like protein
MRHSLIRTVIVLILASTITACSGGQTAKPLNELQRAHSGPLAVVMLSDSDTLRQGKSSLVLEFRDSAGKLVDVGMVTVNATMTMPGMAPMFGDNSVKQADTKGRYDVATDLGMAGTWRFTVAWNGPAGRGSVSMPATAL